MTRTQQIDAGRLWRVHPDNDPDKILCEGTKTACRRYIKDNSLRREVKRGTIRIGQVIWERLAGLEP